MLIRALTLGLVVAAMAGSIARAESSDADTIRSLRAAYNHAIATRDVKGLAAAWLPDVHITDGRGGLHTGGAAAIATFFAGKFFDDPTFVTFVRTPVKVELSKDRTTAAETGTWAGTWRGDHAHGNSGVYQAMWRKTDGAWKIVYESYIELDSWAEAGRS
jgi:uncharacterized protein (TIGR02246 family)